MRARRGRAWAVGLLLALLLCSLAAWTQASAPAHWTRLAQNQTIYHGNLRSKKFHRPGCRYYYCKNCVVRFTSREQAIKAGYVPCKVCRP